jgi:hypothetical protein
VSEYEHNEHLLDEIQRLRESNFQLRQGAEEQKQRIKRLEEAGDKMADLLLWQSRMDRKTSPSASAWRKAKEDKP